MEEILQKRVIIVAGKGGVGRTTATASLALWAQRAGKRVLVAEIGEETADYSPLARLFGSERLPRLAAPIAPGIWGSRLLANEGFERFLLTVLKVPALARAAVESEALNRLLGAAPSFREMGYFYHLLTYLKERRPDGSNAYDLILIDTPATGHMLALTALPDMLLKLLPWGPIPAALREGQAYINDPAKGAAYVVTLPEQLPVTETLEIIAGLVETRIHVGGVIVNRMPQMTFSPAECAALEPMLTRHRLFGAEGYYRAQWADRAVSRLSRETTAPIYTLLEVAEQGPDLAIKLAETLPQASRRSSDDMNLSTEGARQ